MENKKAKFNPSEVHAYVYIQKELIEKKGWNKDNIYTQGECLKNSEIKKFLGQTKPENMVEVVDNIFYVIEAKNERKKIEQALNEAKEYYADKINQSNKIRCPFATGIAGNSEEGFIAKSRYFKNGKWETIAENGVEITGLLSKKQAESILCSKNPNIEDVEITEEEFLGTAENINEILHENSINKDYRARFISALLLAMSDGKEIDITQDCDVLIDDINARVKHILRQHNKLNFSNFIKIDEPSSPDNHIKVKEAIKKTYQELLNLNIRSAMNSGKDVLGKFYEVFLKYGNGAKDIGIVLTPRHITKFASQVLDITHRDLVLDPTCGTGGFLVSAFDEVRRKTKNKEDFENFRLNGLYGIEEQDPIISLAIVNMIFRGDGKNNMIEGNCFRKWLNARTEGKKYYAEYLPEDASDRIAPITKVMMNPPFALKKGVEKEYKFVEHALKQMEDGGILFTVLPISVLVEKGTKKWRKDILLQNNKLLAVITFPEDLFNPSASVGTVGLFVKKGIAHNFKRDKVYFARCMQDGFKMKKGVRKESDRVKNLLEEIKEELKNFIKNPTNVRVKNIPEFKKICLLDEQNEDCELVAEAYLESSIPTFNELKQGLGEMIREAVAFKIKYSNKLNNKKD
ncbi:MAG: N-6 DNA methylase [Atribacterota bacterium]|nr:N-6 DNA methylase [Atribacterota bacterium]